MMNRGWLGGCVALVAVCASSVGCAAADRDAGNAPDVALDELDERDQGSSYNGWGQSLNYRIYYEAGVAEFTHQLSRTSGDATRGGGACSVYQTGTSCSTDTTCTTEAKSSWGASAYGYCYSGVCYARMGSPSGYCSQSDNRAPGSVTVAPTAFAGTNLQPVDYVLGCMTKTAGPNSACGGTNTSAYMRLVKRANYFGGEFMP